MLTKRLTSYIYLKACRGHKVAARLEPGDNNNVNAIITESSETCKGMFGEDITLHPDQHYLVGEIADRLYAYEGLGYSPEELKKIIEEHKHNEAVTKLVEERVMSFKNGSHLYMTTARQNGKSLLDAKYALQLAMHGYLVDDAETTRKVRGLRAAGPFLDETHDVSPCDPFAIENVIFNDPATIVFWKDGTKTVVKATNEDFDPEKGLAMAISKKALGNKGNYFDVFKKWTKKYKKRESINLNVGTVAARAANAMKKLSDALAPKVTKED